MTGGRSWRRTPIRQHKRTPPNNQGGVGRQQQQHSEESIVLKHSPFYSESQFSDLISSHPGLSILDMNICNAFTKFDELELFIFLYLNIATFHNV